MPTQTATVLVADSDSERRNRVALAFTEGGFEVVKAVDGEEALRFLEGVKPTLVVAHVELEKLDPLALREKISPHKFDLPPFLILYDSEDQLPEEKPGHAVYFLPSSEASEKRLINQGKLLILAREVGAETTEEPDTIRGHLSRVPVAELLRLLSIHVMSAEVSIEVGDVDAHLWVKDGVLMNASWGRIQGVKAFNRIAGLKGGQFTLKLTEPEVPYTIVEDLPKLVSQAVEDRLKTEQLLAELPSLSSLVKMSVGEKFFMTNFTPLEQAVLTLTEQAKTLGELLDLVDAPDSQVLEAVRDLRETGFLTIKDAALNVTVVTDSTSDLPRELAQQLGIQVIPLSVIFGNEIFKDGIDLTPEEFYKKLQETKDLPTTNPPTKGEFLELYKRLVPSGDVLSIHISSHLSETLKNAKRAVTEGAEDFKRIREETGWPSEPRIVLVDSLQASVSLGLLVIFAARMLKKGLTLDDTASRMEKMKKRYHLYFVVDTLEYLRRGGRIGRARALLGTLLGIKPILKLEGGVVTPVERVRGGRNVQPRLIEILKTVVDPEKPLIAGVFHAMAPKWAGRMVALLKEAFQVVELFEGMIGPVVGTHVGPGCVGVVVFQPTEEEIPLLLEM